MRAFAFVLLVCIVRMPSQAGIIATDLETFGDGFLTYDIINKREWLDLPCTSGMRLSEVMAQMEPGGRLEGFEFAMLEDVTSLAESAGVIWSELILPNTPDKDAKNFVDLLGWIIQLSGGILPDIEIVLGLIAHDFTAAGPIFDDTNFYAWTMMVGDDLEPGGLNSPIYLDPQPTGGVYLSGPYSHPWFPDLPPMGTGDIGPFWLYRAVPEPTSIPLLTIALACATSGRGFVRNRQAASGYRDAITSSR